MKKYYVKCYGFSNTYDVVYAENEEEEKKAISEGWGRISRKRAIRLCMEEKSRRKYDQAFSYYAPTVILPISYPEDGSDWRNDAAMELRGYIVERRK